jgi:hypothetical protein
MEKGGPCLQRTSPTQRELQSRAELQGEVRSSRVHRRWGRKAQQAKVHVDKRLRSAPFSAWFEIQTRHPAFTVVISPSVCAGERRHVYRYDREVSTHDRMPKVEQVAAQANARREHLLSRMRTDDVDYPAAWAVQIVTSLKNGLRADWAYCSGGSGDSWPEEILGKKSRNRSNRAAAVTFSNRRGIVRNRTVLPAARNAPSPCPRTSFLTTPHPRDASSVGRRVFWGCLDLIVHQVITGD